LLSKQDKLSELELRLQTVDTQETEPLYLGSCRADKSSERKQILMQIDKALSDYGMTYSDFFEGHLTVFQTNT
jgi:hypothetical protein